MLLIEDRFDALLAPEDRIISTNFLSFVYTINGLIFAVFSKESLQVCELLASKAHVGSINE